MPSPKDPSSRPSYWVNKFRHAFRGTWQEVKEDRSFRVHFSFAAAVIVCAVAFGVSLTEWCLLLLCVTAVLAAELFNSALESMAKAITDEHDPRVGSALDLGSAAVLVAAVGSSIVGGMIFLHRVGVLAGWW